MTLFLPIVASHLPLKIMVANKPLTVPCPSKERGGTMDVTTPI